MQMIRELDHCGLEFARGAVVTWETFACTRFTVAQPSTPTITTFRLAVTKHHISVTGTFHKGAIRSTKSSITQAAHMFRRVPNSISIRLGKSSVCRRGTGSHLLHILTDSTSIAIVGAGWTFTGFAFVSGEAFADSGFTITETLIWAFDWSMCSVGCCGSVHPCGTFGTCSQGTISTRVGWISRYIRTQVACAFIIGTTRALSITSVGAIRHSCC